ncbi:MAG: hypothetical protein P1P88_07555 [Bacteroidales bacterium]|nr:hypothetical protein [Bacteroidales bacterium]
MKKFVLKSLIIFIFPFLFILGYAAYFADGLTDPFYRKFTSSRKKSLIIGSSRASQAIIPSIVEKQLKNVCENEIFNFAFSLDDSPYGPVYLNAIKKKVKNKSKNGLFLICVNPWTISRNKNNINDNQKKFRENERLLSKMFFVNLQVNYEYLIKNYNHGWASLSNKDDSTMVLHDNGWLEISIPMDSIFFMKRLDKNLKAYSGGHLQTLLFSPKRYFFLRRTIEFCLIHGKVFLIRLPVHEFIYNVEQEFMPDFDLKIETLAKEYNLQYLNFSARHSDYRTTDGNHLFKESGFKISREIGKRIKQYEE